MLESTPAFSDPAFEEVALYRSLEQFLRYGDKYSVALLSVIGKIDVAHRAGVAVLSAGKKPFDALLAAQSFFFRKSISGAAVHFSSWKDKVRALLLRMELQR